MQITFQHLMVMVLPLFTLIATFFVAEDYALKKQNLQVYVWKPIKLHIEVAGILIIGIAAAVLLGFISYWVVFYGVYQYL